MNIIKRELRANMKSLLIWICCIAAIIFMMMSEFSAYYNNPEMTAILDSMPKALMEAFSLDSANLTTVSGFVSMTSTYFSIMLGIYAVLLGNSIIAKEERDKTVEFFLTLPVTRQKVIFSKLISAVINCISINAATGLVIYITSVEYTPDSAFYKFLGLMLFTIFIIQMIFLSIGMLLAAIIKRYKKSGIYAVSILLITYILSILVGISDKIDFMKYLTPFKYFEAGSLLNKGRLDTVFLLLSLGIIAVSMAGTFIF
ncbi:MAG: ABC transporter permease subunit, partial [Spirochaetales bacterium]|nr:ABC transporter permease subunit [Spirochaetales bacterium]